MLRVYDTLLRQRGGDEIAEQAHLPIVRLALLRSLSQDGEEVGAEDQAEDANHQETAQPQVDSAHLEAAPVLYVAAIIAFVAELHRSNLRGPAARRKTGAQLLRARCGSGQDKAPCRSSHCWW